MNTEIQKENLDKMPLGPGLSVRPTKSFNGSKSLRPKNQVLRRKPVSLPLNKNDIQKQSTEQA